jgi:HEAT repeat protein
MDLARNAPEYVRALVDVGDAEQKARVKVPLLAALAEAAVPEALDLFRRNLSSDDESLRSWGEFGLRALGTPQARKTLFEAGSTGRRWEAGCEPCAGAAHGCDVSL